MAGKQAVLIIHGIGEQRPMDTLRRFVDVVWTFDKSVQHEFAHAGMFSKPDELSGSFELRRLTTTSDRNDVRTDFYEFYWAHLMKETTLGHVIAWLRSLLFRWPWHVPSSLRPAWFLLVALLLAVAFLAVQTVLPEDVRLLNLPKPLTGSLGLLLAWCIVPLINSIVGDAARYLLPTPTNIQQRQEIRAKGVELLNKLHESEYQRIIVVGHSLGSVIGYDILTHAWPAYARERDSRKPNPALDEIEKMIPKTMDGPAEKRDFDIKTFRARQRALGRELRANGCRWKVTDFVTLGSPLTHAEILLAHDRENFKRKKVQREFPACPPELEGRWISYPAGAARRRLHHAAPFGPTRWTNIFFPARWIVFGDIIGGPLNPLFGCGILDYQLKATRQRWGLLSHTLYWTMGRQKTKEEPVEEHIRRLREAVNLLDE